MQFDKLFELLLREDVKEIALQADRPPCALTGGRYVPVLKRNFSEDEIIELLGTADGRSRLMGLIDGPQAWEFDHPEVGRIRVQAGYHSNQLQSRFQLLAPKPKLEPKPEPKPN